MKNIIKLIFFVLVITVQGQEYSVYLSGGSSGLKYIDIDNSKLKLGGGFGLGYAHSLSKKWDALTGVEFGSYRDNWSLDQLKQTRYLIDDRSSAFEYRLSVNSLVVNSTGISVNIPLMLRYKMDLGIPAYLNFGGKILLPIEQNIIVSANNIKLHGYYPNKNLLYDNLPKHGFGNITELNSGKTRKLKTAFSLSGEFGTVIKTSLKSRFYVGFYIDYGLSEIRKETIVKKDNPLFIEYSSKGLDYVSFSDNLEVLNAPAMLLACGIQLRYAFDITNKDRKNLINNQVDEEKSESNIIVTTEDKQDIDADKKVILDPKHIKQDIIHKKLSVEIVKEDKPEIQLKGKNIPDDLLPKIFSTGVFGYKQHRINNELQLVLDNVVSDYNDSKYNLILIETYTDCRGSKKYNLNLSKKRSLQIYNYFINNGISPKSIKYKYYGETKIKNKCKNSVNCSEEEHKENRLVIVTLK